jgi:hypothetical protein
MNGTIFIFKNRKKERKLELQAVMQGSKKCAFRRHNAKHVFEIEERRMPKDAADSSESVDITFLTVGASVWEL